MDLFPFQHVPLEPMSTLDAAKTAAYIATKHSYFINHTNIPLIIHQTWKTAIMDSHVPIHVQRSVNSWKTMNQNAVYLLWDDENMDLMVKEMHPDWYYLYSQLRQPVMKADLFRYLVLLSFGGVVSILQLGFDLLVFRCRYNLFKTDFRLGSNRRFSTMEFRREINLSFIVHFFYCWN